MKHSLTGKLCLSLILSVTTICSLFPQYSVAPVITKKTTFHERNPYCRQEVLRFSTQMNDSVHTTKKRVIVEFEGESLAIIYCKGLDKKQLKEQAQYMRNLQSERFETFKKDLNRIYEAGYILKGTKYYYSTKPETGREYRITYFGQQVTVDSLMIEEIEKLPYVKAVHPDRKVKATLEESVPQINADSVWNELDCEGDSIRVGIIDTGIDYNHPDLGGGFGPGYKVIGGYDFVNLDDNPMDDNEHGTHVAGIVAADGVVRGVAPKALLYALKVLDNYGGGWSSDIISAIEYTVDPNSDFDFSDKLDVANMSLGGSVSEDDPMVDAVEAAIELGVTYCIAAGNSGYNMSGTIDSPGTSPSAITVGAVDKSDSMAIFSGVGPTAYTYLLKPEIVAPGEDINSTIPGGGHAFHGGTSMATPHVAGTCALLKRLHPDWGPQELKAAIMITARDIGKEKVLQGSGIVNAYRAAIANTLVDKATLHFGLDSLGAAQVWIQTDSIQIRNISGTIQDYTLSAGETGSGISISLSQENFTLNSYDSISIIVTIEVDNSLLEISVIRGSPMYNGDIFLQNSEQSFHVNWAFNRGVMVEFNPVGHLYNIFIFNPEYMFSGVFDWDIPQSILIKPGNYYLVAEFTDEEEYSTNTRWTLVKNINLESSAHLLLDPAEAVNKVIFATEDESGNQYSPQLAKARNICIAFNDSAFFETSKYSENENGRAGWQSVTTTSGRRMTFISTECTVMEETEEGFRSMDTLYFSDLPENVRIILGETRRNRINGYHFCFNHAGPVNELTGDLTLNGDASMYRTLYINEPKPSMEHMWWPKLHYKTGRVTDWMFVIYGDFERNISLFSVSMPSVEDNTDDFYYYFTLQRYFDFYTAPLKCVDNQFMFGEGKTPGAVSIEPNDTITYSRGPWSSVLRSGNNDYDDYPVLLAPAMNGGFDEVSIDNYGEWVLYNELEEPVDTNTYPYLYSDQEPGLYHASFKINNNTAIYNKPIKNYIDTWFDLRLEDPDPPTPVSFHVLDPEGNQTHVIDKNDSATLLFTLSDEEYIDGFIPGGLPVDFDSVQVFAKKHSETEWLQLDVDSLGYDSRDGLSCRSVITGTDYDSTHFDVKIVCADDAGNRTETVISPAFYIKNILPPVANDDNYTLSENDDPYYSDHGITENDINPFGNVNELQIEILSDVTHGSMTLNVTTSKFTYRPTPGYTGTDLFTYRVRNEKYTSNIATVTLNIIPSASPDLPADENRERIVIYPNPASEFLNIGLTLDKAEEITISVYDVTGTKLAIIHSGFLEMGRHNLVWDLKDALQNRLNPGVYLISLQGENSNVMVKIIIE